MDKKVKLGIIGIGNMGTGHMGNVIDGKCPELELVAVADTNPDRIAWAKNKYEVEAEEKAEINYFNDAIEMLDSGLIEACIVAVPHYDHTVYAIECMKRGIHVMVEKPAGVYTKAVREMNKVSKEHPEVVFGMMFNQRTNCLYRKLKEMIDSGEYGNIRRTNWIVTDWYRPQAYYDSGNWRATWFGEGGGVLLNQCPHQLDLWQWLCGMPVKVSTYMHFGKWHDIEVEDDVTTYVEYENGATGVFITSTGDAKGSNRLEIQMDKAKFIIENNELLVDVFEMSEPEFSKTNTELFATVNSEKFIVETDGKNEQHVGVLNAFAGAILRGEPLVANGVEGINGLTLSNAMHLSAFLGKPIEIPFDEDLYYEELMKRVASSRRKTEVKAVFADTKNTYAGNK